MINFACKTGSLCVLQHTGLLQHAGTNACQKSVQLRMYEQTKGGYTSSCVLTSVLYRLADASKVVTALLTLARIASYKCIQDVCRPSIRRSVSIAMTQPGLAVGCCNALTARKGPSSCQHSIALACTMLHNHQSTLEAPSLLVTVSVNSVKYTSCVGKCHTACPSSLVTLLNKIRHLDRL